MSTATTHAEASDNHEVEHHCLSDKQYIVIALSLAAVTAIEVSTYYVDFGPFFMPVLLILMSLNLSLLFHTSCT